MTVGAHVSEAPRVDPITFKMVRHRVWAILDEMAGTLVRTSGNPSITEAHDFMVALFTAEGEIALGGWGIVRHVSCTAQACRGILERFPAQEIEEDDVFLLNDPYVAAIHQPDVYILSPVHFEGKLVAWVGNFTHLADIGGIDPGSSPRATHVLQEGLRIPGLKIADRGVLREDVWETLLHMTREPEMNALQLKAQMAANHTGKQKLLALLNKIGFDQYRAIVGQMMDQTEQALRGRLRALPDGTWRTREYLDTPDRIYTVELAMTKRDDELHFDFSGTSEQAPSFVNCTYWGTRGGIFVSLAHLLGFGLPWNQGLLAPLALTVPEGSLLNCTYPAPVSMSTVAASRVATIASWNTLARMLAMGDGFALSAPWGTGANGLRLAGIARPRRYFVLTTWADTGGGGARRSADGIDTSGGTDTPMGAIPNVETLERSGPVLYLFRRQVPDSGGPGTHRGGVSAEVAFTLHKAPDGRLTAVLLGTGAEPAQIQGVFGGLPGCNTLFELRTDTRVQEYLREAVPTGLDQLGGEVRHMPPQGLFEIDAASVFHTRADGGGGLGNPLRRPVERVLADVRAGLVTREQARERYGVVVDEQARVDVEATARLRARQSGRGEPTTDGATLTEDRLITKPVTYDHARGIVTCSECGHALSGIENNWRARAVEASQPLSSLGVLMASTRFVLRTWRCPGCDNLLDTEMSRPEDPPLHPYSPLASDSS
jgi:N-methylhydantoinase B